MEQRVLEVSLVSAEGLKDVSHLGKVRAYAEAWVDPCAKQVSSLDKQGGTHPTWNHTFSFTLPSSSFHHPSARLTIQILHRTHLAGCNSFIGSSIVSLRDFLTSSKTLLSYPVMHSPVHQHGFVHIRVRLGDKYVADQGTHTPVMAYPAYPESIPKGPPQFPRYPNSRSYLPRGYPAVPYYPPPSITVPSSECK